MLSNKFETITFVHCTVLPKVFKKKYQIANDGEGWCTAFLKTCVQNDEKNIIPVWKKETFFDIFFDISISFRFTNWLHVNHKRLNYILKFVFCSKYEI